MTTLRSIRHFVEALLPIQVLWKITGIVATPSPPVMITVPVPPFGGVQSHGVISCDPFENSSQFELSAERSYSKSPCANTPPPHGTQAASSGVLLPSS